MIHAAVCKQTQTHRVKHTLESRLLAVEMSKPVWIQMQNHHIICTMCL